MLYPVVSTYHFHHASGLSAIPVLFTRYWVLSQEPLRCSQYVITPALGPCESLEKFITTRRSDGGRRGVRNWDSITAVRGQSRGRLFGSRKAPYLLFSYSQPCNVTAATASPHASNSHTTYNTPPSKNSSNRSERMSIWERQGKGAACKTDIRVEHGRVFSEKGKVHSRTGRKGPGRWGGGV